MKIAIDGYHVRNVCRRCFWFVPREVAGVVIDFRCIKSFSQFSEVYPYSSCEDFVYSSEIDKDYSYIDFCNKRKCLMQSLKMG